MNLLDKLKGIPAPVVFQAARKLRECMSQADVCQRYGITPMASREIRRRYKGMTLDEIHLDLMGITWGDAGKKDYSGRKSTVIEAETEVQDAAILMSEDVPKGDKGRADMSGAVGRFNDCHSERRLKLSSAVKGSRLTLGEMIANNPLDVIEITHMEHTAARGVTECMQNASRISQQLQRLMSMVENTDDEVFMQYGGDSIRNIASINDTLMNTLTKGQTLINVLKDEGKTDRNSKEIVGTVLDKIAETKGLPKPEGA